MTYRQFIVPTDQDFEAVLGITPEVRGEDGVRGIVALTTDDVDIDLTIDPLGQSVALIVRHNAIEVVRITREGAAELRLAKAPPEITIEFGTDDTTGRIEVMLAPSIHISETTLLR